jgi:hypothetical protein
MIESTMYQMVVTLLNGYAVKARVVFNATGNSIQAKAALVLGLAHDTHIPDLWLEELDQNLRYVQNDLAPKRNRIIHDNWIATNEGLSQIDIRVPLKRQQSRTRKFNQDSALHKRNLQDLWDLVRITEYIGMDLSSLHTELAGWKNVGHPPRPRGQPRLGERIAAPLPYNQDAAAECR